MVGPFSPTQRQRFLQTHLTGEKRFSVFYPHPSFLRAQKQKKSRQKNNITLWELSVLKKMQNTFQKIYWIVRSKRRWMERKKSSKKPNFWFFTSKKALVKWKSIDFFSHPITISCFSVPLTPTIESSFNLQSCLWSSAVPVEHESKFA